MKTVQLNIDKFLGLHSDALGDTELKIGELSAMQNFKITENYNLEKRTGYNDVLTSATAHSIQGQWYGKLNGTDTHLFASNGHIYKNVGDGSVVDLGTLTDAKTNFFYFGDSVYIQNGSEYKKYAGGSAISDVTGYVPIIMNSRNMGSSSTGTLQEGVNILNNQRRMKFNGVSGQTVAYLSETGITSVDKVYVNGALQTVTTHYTVSLANGTVTFVTAPAVGIDNVEIYWTNLTKSEAFDGNGSKTDFQLKETSISSVSSVKVNDIVANTIVIKACTFSNASSFLSVNCSSHGYAEGATVQFTGASLPSNVSAGVTYSVSVINSSRFYIGRPGIGILPYISGGSGSVFLVPSYSSNLTTGIVTMTPAPSTGSNNVYISYVTSSTNASTITNNTNSKIYGGKNDTRVFVYGYDNIVYYSDLADGVPSAEYFPALNFIKIGSNNTKVTDLAKQYDRLIIFKEADAWWTSYEYTSLIGVEFPIYPLNDTIGCSVKGTSQIIQNNPFVIFGNKVYQFVASNVRDERNVAYMSLRVQPLLDAETMTSLITFDNEGDGEYWIILAKEIYIYNYELDVWYYYLVNDTITSICKTNYVTIGTSGGQLMKFDTTSTDNGTSISAFAKTGFINYGTAIYRKFVNFIWIQLYNDGMNSSADIYYQTDKDVETLVKSIPNFLSTESKAKSIRLKPKMKKFVVGKFIIKNTGTTKCRILSISAPAIIGGISK